MGCANLCDANSQCNVFYLNEQSTCELYKSCDQNQTTSFHGTTYQRNVQGIQNLNISLYIQSD